LWLVVELCTAGTLETLLEQDGCLPESSIKQFGIDICEGLFYCHSMGLLFCDLIPKKIMIDGSGNIKLSDFGLSKLEGEDLEEIFQETFETTSSQWQESASTAKPPKVYKKPFGQIEYLAPEILMGEDNSKESDIWSLGCLLYKMYTGSLPFVSENSEQLSNLIINKEFPNPKGNKLSTKPSSEFINLLKGCLEKSPEKRLNWRRLLNHPFWDNKLEHLIPPSKSILDQHLAENEDLDELDDQLNTMNISRILTDRPKTANGSMILEKHPEINVSFSISSRLPTSPHSTMHTRTAVQCHDSDLANTLANTLTGTIEIEVGDMQSDDSRRMFFIASELVASAIVDNPKIQKASLLKFEPKALPFSNAKLFKSSTFLQLAKPEFEKGLEQIKANTIVPNDKSAGAIKVKIHLLNYIAILCTESSKLADCFLRIELYTDLLQIIKNGHTIEMKTKAARVMAIMFNKAKKLDTSKELTETLQSLVDIISSNRKDLKFKQALLPALGEMLYFISVQESLLGRPSESWSVPSLAYVLMIRTIGEDLVSNHIICKIIENIALTKSLNIQKFLNNQAEVVNVIWSCFSHSANNEQLRVGALRALCMLASHSPNIGLTLIDKIGVEALLDCLGSNNSHIQQIMLTLIAITVHEGHLKSFPEKKLIGRLVSLYENANVACRAKAYLLTHILLKTNVDQLGLFTHSKLVNSLERDHRKTFQSLTENEFMHKMIGILLELLTNTAMGVIEETIAVLESVSGRKNPPAAQLKTLKRFLPNVELLKVLVTSQMFRARLIDTEFIEKFGRLVDLSKPVSSGELNLDQICAPGTTNCYMNSLASVLETIIQHKDMLQNFASSILQHILPALVENMVAVNSELKIAGLKFLSELSCQFFNLNEKIVSDEIKRQLRSFIEKSFVDVVNELLVQPEPIPYFTLTIIQTTLCYDITLISILKVRSILPGIFKLFQVLKTKIGSPIMLKILSILSIWSSTLDPLDLYEFNIVDYLKSIMLEIHRMRKYNDTQVNQVLIELLKISDNLLKYVSEFVKKALQAKKSAVASTDNTLAQQAEKLLHSNKSLAGCGQFLLMLLASDDSDIAELACKILWVLMQLFGGECKDLLNQENMNIIL